jgi:DNA replication protein DnaC
MDKISVAPFLQQIRGDKICPKHDIEKPLIENNYGGGYYRCPECSKEQEIEREWDNSDTYWRETSQKIRDADIPERFKAATLQNYLTDEPGQKEALEKVWKFIRAYKVNPGECLILEGSCGTGKTHLAIGLIKELCKRGVNCKYITAYRAVDRLKSTYGSDETKKGIIGEFTAIGLLVIDELGIDSEAETQKLTTRVIDERYLAVKPTVMITNLSTSELLKMLGERVGDRIKEMSGTRIVCKWKSHRGKKT